VTEQRGFVAGQSVFVRHATQRFVVSSHTGEGAAQSADVRQPRHTPVAASHSFASPGHGAVGEHAGRHLWSPGQHAGAAAPQSPFVRHDPQEPRMQNGSPPPQSASSTHWTQPSAASHFRPPHAVAAASVHAAPPPDVVTSDELPPHAAATKITKPKTSIERVAVNMRAFLPSNGGTVPVGRDDQARRPCIAIFLRHRRP
jgi:hypothetical protein